MSINFCLLRLSNKINFIQALVKFFILILLKSLPSNIILLKILKIVYSTQYFQNYMYNHNFFSIITINFIHISIKFACFLN